MVNYMMSATWVRPYAYFILMMSRKKDTIQKSDGVEYKVAKCGFLARKTRLKSLLLAMKTIKWTMKKGVG